MQSSSRMPAAKQACWTLVVILASQVLHLNALAQTDTLKLTSDELFSLAREKAFAGQREEARGLCRTILVRSPFYSDARILLGRVYAWDGRWEEAREEFRRVLKEKPAYKDALLALLDVEIWDEKFDRALTIANEALVSHPSDEDFSLRKVRALKGLSRDEEALLILNKVEDLNPSLAEIATLRKSISSTSMNNGIGINYASDRFSGTYDPMHYAYLQLSRRTALGSLFGRVNYSSRFGTRGVQVETDLYPRLTDGVYAYLNYGFSNSDLFPKHRAGLEVYTKLPASYEGSVGLRRLQFGPSSSVTIYTGSLGLYVGSYWISFRPYLIPNDAGLSKSASLTLRRYLGDAENFLSLRAGAGFSADERTIQSNSGFLGQTEVFYLQSQTVGIGIQQGVATYHLFVATFDVTNQELSFSSGNYVMMYSLSIGLRVRF
jgi:YaiO family outer membrane protein